MKPRRVELEKKAADVLSAAEKRADALNEFEVKITALASEEGKLFGSIGPRDIAQAVTEAGHALEKSEVEMPEGPIRLVGEYQVTAHLHSEVNANIKITVAAEETQQA